MDDTAIKVVDVSKAFKLPHEKHGSIKNIFLNLFRGRTTYEKQEVLKNLSLEIKSGEFFGIVGRNGSGKSTLLKLLAGVYSPDSGAIQINGKLTPFIELGVGFNPELTGRENVFLNGSLLGFSREQMTAMYDEIVRFAELEKYMDLKLKNYSSGMQVRLAFSIAIRADSEILLLDEVLAVGDEAFQAKCYDYFKELKKNKKTVIIVTHDMNSVQQYCDRAILIKDGVILKDGKPRLVANLYSELNKNTKDIKNYLEDESDLLKVVLSNNKKIYQYDDELTVSLKWGNNTEVDVAGVSINSLEGECVYATNTKVDQHVIKDATSLNYRAKLDIGPGKYVLSAGIWDKNMKILDFIGKGPMFEISPDGSPEGEGIVRLNHKWENK